MPSMEKGAAAAGRESPTYFGVLRIQALQAELQQGYGSAAAAALQMLPGGSFGSSSLEKSGLIPPASKEAISTLQLKPDTPSWILELGWEHSLTDCSHERVARSTLRSWWVPPPFPAPRQPRLCSLIQTPFTKLGTGIPAGGDSPKATHGSSQEEPRR